MDNDVRELHESHGLAQAQPGEAAGVSRQSISSIEKGRYDPPLPLAVACYLGTTVEEIVHA